jgi:hypothetical protein
MILADAAPEVVMVKQAFFASTRQIRHGACLLVFWPLETFYTLTRERLPVPTKANPETDHLEMCAVLFLGNQRIP